MAAEKSSEDLVQEKSARCKSAMKKQQKSERGRSRDAKDHHSRREQKKSSTRPRGGAAKEHGRRTTKHKTDVQGSISDTMAERHQDGQHTGTQEERAQRSDTKRQRGSSKNGGRDKHHGKTRGNRARPPRENVPTERGQRSAEEKGRGYGGAGGVGGGSGVTASSGSGPSSRDTGGGDSASSNEDSKTSGNKSNH